MPADSKILPESDKEHAFPTLRHAIMRRVHHMRDDSVVQARATSAGMVLLQSRQMVSPSLVPPCLEAGMLKLQANVLEIIPEAGASQTLDVFKDKSGQRQEQTEFHRVVVWGRQAEIAREYLRRGRMVFIEGRLQTRSWEDKSGQKRWQTEVVAERLQLGPRPGAAPPGESRPAQEGETGKAGKQKDADDTIPVIDEDAPISLHDDEPKEVNPEEIPF